MTGIFSVVVADVSGVVVSIAVASANGVVAEIVAVACVAVIVAVANGVVVFVTGLAIATGVSHLDGACAAARDIFFLRFFPEPD